MEVVAFNGSARKNGNTAILVNRVFQELQKQGIETELVQLSGEKIRGCIACNKCFDNKDQRCSQKQYGVGLRRDREKDQAKSA